MLAGRTDDQDGDVSDAAETSRPLLSDRTSLVAAASIVVALAVMAIKYWAYVVTGSVALYSDALESIVNLVTAIAALVAIRFSAQPADANHPFGHHKAEYFSAVLEGALIIVAAILILKEAYAAIQAPRTLDEPWTGLMINGVAGVINTAWATCLVIWGRAWRSPALVADGWHLATDVITSVGVLVGLGLAVVTGWAILDPIMAAAVAVHILFTGWRLTRESMSGLIDEAVAPALQTRIRETISTHAKGAIEAHDLRTRVAGRATFIEFHLVVPGDMTVADAHAICDRLETVLADVAPGAEVLIHVEPEGEARHRGIVVV
jgi:cation diffusion facilitator family transporter